MLRNSVASAGSGNQVPLQDLSSNSTPSPRETAPPRSPVQVTSQSFSPPLNPIISQASSDYFPRNYHRSSEASGTSRASRASRASRSSQASLTPAQVHAIITARRNSRATRDLSISKRNPSIAEQDDDVLIEEETDDPLARLLDFDDQPVPTPHCSQDFGRVALRIINAELRGGKDPILEASQIKKAQHEQTLRALRAWVDERSKMQGFKGFLKRTLRLNHVPRRPDPAALVEMAKYYYPPRGDLKVYICDFGKDRFSKKDVPLGKIDEGKPGKSWLNLDGSDHFRAIQQARMVGCAMDVSHLSHFAEVSELINLVMRLSTLA